MGVVLKPLNPKYIRWSDTVNELTLPIATPGLACLEFGVIYLLIDDGMLY